MKSTYLQFFVLLIFFSCANEKDNDFPFDSLSPSQSGIQFSNELVDTDSFNIMQYLYYYNGGGVAAGDLNNDGNVDLYFTGNQVNDALYFNDGNLSFTDASKSSGINEHNGWSTGVTMLDINKDGWLDIYVCRLGKYKMYNDHNRLYVNNQDGTFTESAKSYGLDFSGFSTQAAFFDYDNDGDLDCYLLNHSVKRPDQFVQADKIRYEVDSLAGDRFYRNYNGKFVDITTSSGIYASSVGFGLSACVADLNYDGWADIYVGNDFHENDYMYLNQRDGTFKEVIDKAVGHTSNFTMGSTIASIGKNGGLDIFSLDMLPKNEEIFKQSGGWESKQIYDFKRDYGYHHQSPKNAMQVYVGHKNDVPIYSEQASLFNVQASDWSWTPIIKDFDLNGQKDIYITNGIFRRPNDMDFVNYFSDPQNGNKTDLEMIEKMPSGRVANQYFSQKDFQFSEINTGNPTISNGACTADLDNDGDLDIIVNNLNEKASLLINSTNPSRYLRIKLKGDSLRTMAKSGLLVYGLISSGMSKMTLLSGNKGFLSMDEEIAILYHPNDTFDVYVVFPDNHSGQYTIEPNTREFTLTDASLNTRIKDNSSTSNNSTQVRNSLVDTIYQHIENQHNDQNSEPLQLYGLSQNGPKITQSKEGTIFITQAKGNNGSIIDPKSKQEITKIDKGIHSKLVDETDALFYDADGDGDDDLYVCLGGNELLDGDVSLPDMLFINEDGQYSLSTKMLPKVPRNTSTVSASDYDNDGDLDLFVGVQSKVGDFGNPDASYVLRNIDNKNYQAFMLSVKEMVFDSQWADLDRDGRQDLIIVGHWMPITILYNREKGFEKFEIPNSEGWWYSVEVDDFDKDGVLDIMAGNFGKNHRLSVSEDSPLKMYVSDFDKNRRSDPIVSYQIDGKEYPYANLDLLLKQIPSKKKQFIRHADYAQKTITELFTPEDLKKSTVKTVKTLSSSVFFQDAYDQWETKPLPQKTQLAPIWAIEPHRKNYVVGGNHFDIDPNLGRQDALPLSMIQFIGRDVSVIRDDNLPVVMEEVRSFLSLGRALIIGVNDGAVIRKWHQ